MAKPNLQPYTCVACGLNFTPTAFSSYRDAPTNFHENVILSGKAKPGPHCRLCTHKILQASAAVSRLASFDREKARQESFKIPKPSHLNDHQWSIIKSHACCPKALLSPCVCMYSFTCLDHGGTHVGTHD